MCACVYLLECIVGGVVSLQPLWFMANNRQQAASSIFSHIRHNIHVLHSMCFMLFYLCLCLCFALHLFILSFPIKVYYFSFFLFFVFLNYFYSFCFSKFRTLHFQYFLLLEPCLIGGANVI